MEKPFYELDTFGSERIQVEEIQHDFGPQLDEFVKSSDWKKGDEKNPLREDLQAQIRQKYGLAYVRLSLITYFGKDAGQFLTVDVVEHQDKERRMPFIDAPKGRYGDPGNLFQAWDEYFRIGMDLVAKEELSVDDLNETVGFHTAFGHRHPSLAKYKQIFTEGVLAHQAELEQIFLDEVDDNKRANAAFLLAYLPDGNHLVNVLLQRFDDKASEVRNNVMRVFTYIAKDHPEVDLPLERIVEALNYPHTTDRNKAVAIISMFTANPERLATHRPEIMKAVPILIKMLVLKQPNNHGIAYHVLQNLAAHEYGEENIPAWEAWAEGNE